VEHKARRYTCCVAGSCRAVSLVSGRETWRFRTGFAVAVGCASCGYGQCSGRFRGTLCHYHLLLPWRWRQRRPCPSPSAFHCLSVCLSVAEFCLWNCKLGFISRFIAEFQPSRRPLCLLQKHVKSRNLIHFYVVIKTDHRVTRYEVYWPGQRRRFYDEVASSIKQRTSWLAKWHGV
jgi:hypothetical protein